MRALVLSALLLLPVPRFAQSPTVSPGDAARYVGQTVTVQGVVSQVSVSRRSGTTFLNFGGRYPNHGFTAVIFRRSTSLFPDPQQYEGRRVRVTGQVRMYNGKPEIVLESPDQLQP